MARVAGEAFFIFTEDDFAWEEPGAAAAALPLAPALPSAPALPRRRRQTRTFAGDLARLRDAFGISPLALLAILAFVALAAVGIRLLVAGDERSEGKRSPPRSMPSSPAPGTTPGPLLPAAARTRTLEPGDRGAGVRDLQAALAALGFYADGADGAFGAGTAAAVAAFQGDRGLDVDGVAGPLTAEALVMRAAERASARAREAEEGLASAVRAGRLREEEAARYRTVLTDSLTALGRLSPGRSATVGLVLEDVAANASEYDEPRALTLFAMLEANVRHLAANPLPAAAMVDIEGEDGVVYRYFAAHGFQFHPLANFARLNRLVKKERREDVRRLVTALAARAVPEGDTLTWEYYFAFGGPPRWSSGLAQAVGAQALARSGALLADRALFAQARRAYRTIPATFVLELAGGLWIREYSFSDMPILNAQLQSLISVSDYARIVGDAAAEAVAARMSVSSRALLARFDTGCWSRYSLDGSDASLSYHTYHVALLQLLAHDGTDPLWGDTATRWSGYLDAGKPVSGACA